jgi:WD40 repeat protein
MDKTARIWDAETGKELKKIEEQTNWILSVAFSPDGKKIVTPSNDFTARIWDVDSDSATFGKVLKKFEGHTMHVYSAVFSPDGKKIVTGSDDGTARIWDVDSGKELQICKIPNPFGVWQKDASAVCSVAFSPDGKRIVTGGGDRIVRIWDAESGKELKTLEGHADVGIIYAVAFSPDGKKVVSSSGDKTARIWDVETGKELKKLEMHPYEVGCAAFSPDGKKVITAHAGAVQIWDAETGKELRKIDGCMRASFSPDGKTIIAGNYDAKIAQVVISTVSNLRKLLYFGGLR